MLQPIEKNKVKKELIPHCPRCGKEMSVNLRCDNTFVEDKGWNDAQNRYLKFIEENKNKKILFLELGVGMNTPMIIKIPFIKMTCQFKDAFYVPINIEESYLPKEVENKSFPIEEELSKIIEVL